MRPKIVIITLLFGAGLLAVLGVMHGIMTRQDGSTPPAGAGGSPAEATRRNPPAEAKNQNVGPKSPIAVTPDEEKAAKKQKDLDAIADALVAGERDPNSMLAIANQLDNPDKEVRTSAREAAVHLGNTNIIPYLNAGLGYCEDPREKVAILDAIAYLQLPTEAAGDMAGGTNGSPIDLDSIPAGVDSQLNRRSGTNAARMRPPKAVRPRPPRQPATAPQAAP